jgi:folate-binding protein YgfZ
MIPMTQLFITTLDKLGVLRFRGPDASRFLQGQLSNDIERLTTEDSLLTGLHNAQGRTLAVLRMFALQPDDLLAVLPLALLPAVSNQLSRYVLRSKLSIADVGAEWRVAGLYGYDAQAAAQLRKRVALDDEGLRYLVVAPRHDPLPDGEEMDFDDWHGMDIIAGRPQVYPATSGQFVAQMLNLDLLDAISFDKGCYTGQEVIARAHYRGKVKRRMQRFATEDGRLLAAGDRVQIADGRVLHIVDLTRMPGGGWDFLAVAPLAANVVDTALESATARTLDAAALPLPYSLPD